MKKSKPANLIDWNAAIGFIVKNDAKGFAQWLKKNSDAPHATMVDEPFIKPLQKQFYKGDTLLHVAAAGYNVEIAKILLKAGARIDAMNRRGAQPLHTAAVGAPGWHTEVQVRMLELLVKAGANVNARDKSGVTPLHRAVRTRSSAAVETLLKLGADPRARNEGNGSTPLHLAVQTTGRGGSGSKESRMQQMKIIRLLLSAGASPNDKNRAGKTVLASTKDKECLELLA